VSRSSRAAAVAAALLAPPCGRALADTSAKPSGDPGFYQKFVANRLTLGVRSSWFHLEDTRRYAADGSLDNGNLQGNFLGSLWGLDAQQRPIPFPFLEYRVVSALGAGVAYDQARAKTLDWADETQTATAGDGDVEIRGVQAYVFGRAPRWGRLTPYGQLGLSRYASSFYALPGWAIPGRHFEVDGTHGWFAAVGGHLSLGRHLGMDLQLRHSQTQDVSARAYFLGNRHRSGAFPMRCDSLGAGVFYAF
jgi:hypothetical protein